MSIVYAVRHVMSKPLITIDSKNLVKIALNLMVQKSIGALVVTEKKPVGIITERDIMRVCCPDASCTKTKVEEIMSKPLVTVDADTPIGAAVQLMTRKNIRRLLVTEKDEIIGIVTERDLMRGTLEALHALNYSVDLI